MYRAGFRTAALLGFFVLVCAARAEVRYTITDMGDLGQHFADPYGLSENGQVAGQSFTASGQSRGFFWSASSGIVDLIPPGNPGTRPTGSAAGVNDFGQVVGHISPDYNAIPQAFLWSASTGLRQLGTLGGLDSRGRAINNVGQVAGESGVPGGALHAFIWSPSTGMQDIAPAGGQSSAAAINDQGQITGYTLVAGQSRAFRWSEPTGMMSLGTLGGVLSQGFAINNSGEVSGYRLPPKEMETCIRTPSCTTRRACMTWARSAATIVERTESTTTAGWWGWPTT